MSASKQSEKSENRFVTVVFLNGAEIDRVTKQRGTHIPESRRAGFPSVREACVWVDQHFSADFPSERDLESGRVLVYADDRSEPLDGEAAQAWLRDDSNWAADFDFTLEEQSSITLQTFYWRRTRRGWAVECEGEWSLACDTPAGRDVVSRYVANNA